MMLTSPGLMSVGHFCHNHDVGTEQCAHRFAQTSQRQHFIVIYRAVPFGEYNRCRWLYISVLECVVEYYEVDTRIKPQQLFDSFCPAFAYSHTYVVAIFLIYLIWFVAYGCRCGAFVGKDESFCPTPVAA